MTRPLHTRRTIHTPRARAARIATTIVVATSAVGAGAYDPGADDSIPPEFRRTLTRRIDPIIVTGESFGDFLGVRKDQVRVYALRGGRFLPIPYQIDEKLPNGEYAYERGKLASEDVDHGRIDENDELVFLAQDAGDRAPRSQWVEGHGGGVEIIIEDPLDGGRAWAYLLAFRDPPPRSEIDYVTGRIETDNAHYVDARDYHIDNAKFPPNAFRPTDLRVRRPETDDLGMNLIDATKLRIQISYKFIRLTKDETEFQTIPVGEIDGPVRIITRNEMKMYLFLGIWLPSPESTSVMYPWGYSVPNKIKLPVTANDGPDSFVRISFDHNPAVKDMVFYSDRNPTPVQVDGKMSPEEAALDRHWPSWVVAMSREGTRIGRMILDPRLNGDNRLYYNDDASLDDAPEFHRGAWGEHGFHVALGGIPKGTYDLDYHSYLVPDFHMGDEREYVQVLDHPLRVIVGKPL